MEIDKLVQELGQYSCQRVLEAVALAASRLPNLETELRIVIADIRAADRRRRAIVPSPRKELTARLKEIEGGQEKGEMEEIFKVIRDFMKDIIHPYNHLDADDTFTALTEVDRLLSKIQAARIVEVESCRNDLRKVIKQFRDQEWWDPRSIKGLGLINRWVPQFSSDLYLDTVFSGYLFSEEYAVGNKLLDNPRSPSFEPYPHAITTVSPTLLLSFPSETLRLIFHFAAEPMLPRYFASKKDQKILHQRRALLLRNLALVHPSWTQEAQFELISFAYINSKEGLDSLLSFLSRGRLKKKLLRLKLDYMEESGSKVWISYMRLTELCPKLPHLEYGGSGESTVFSHLSPMKCVKFTLSSTSLMEGSRFHQIVPALQHISFINTILSEFPLLSSPQSLTQLTILEGSLETQFSRDFPNLTTLTIDSGAFSSTFIRSPISVPNLEQVIIRFRFAEFDRYFKISLVFLIRQVLSKFKSIKRIKVKLGCLPRFGRLPSFQGKLAANNADVKWFTKKLVELAERKDELSLVELIWEEEDLSG